MSENEEATQTTIFGIQIPTITFEKKIRFIVASIGLIATIVNTVTGISLPKYNVDCVEDMTFNVTSNVNGFLRNSPNFSTFIKSFTSILFDGYIIYAFVGWILYSKNFRFIITFILNIIVYQILKQFWEIRTPSDYYWNEKHLPSYQLSSFGQPSRAAAIRDSSSCSGSAMQRSTDAARVSQEICACRASTAEQVRYAAARDE